MNLVIILILFFVLPTVFVILENLLWFTYLWQVKEYRFDRMFAHFKYDFELKKSNAFILILKIVLLLLALYWFIFPTLNILLLQPAIVFITYLLLFQNFIRTTITSRLVRPKIKSFRNIIILVLSFLALFVPLALISFWVSSVASIVPETINSSLPAFTDIIPVATEEGILSINIAIFALMTTSITILLMDILTLPVVSFFALITEPLAIVKRKSILDKAKKIVAENNNLKVIAITGSYGKTTTKEIVYQILAKKFKTIKTPENNNTDIGIAKTIINSLKPSTEVFVAEMGAYKLGEISKATEVVKPDISIVTTVAEQHLAIFGSIENIFKAKYEIVDGLKETGTAILNGDNEYCLRMAEKTKNKTILYYKIESGEKLVAGLAKSDDISNSLPIDEHIYASNVVQKESGINFKLHYKNNEYKIVTKINGVHNVSNILASIIACVEVGMTIKEVVDVINKIEISSPYLTKKKGVGGTIIIDDGYNAVVNGFISALEFMSSISTNQKKWCVTKGVIELGKSKKDNYVQLTKSITKNLDGLITSDYKLYKEILNSYPNFAVFYVNSDQGIINSYLKLVNEGDFVLIEGRLPSFVLDGILSK